MQTSELRDVAIALRTARNNREAIPAPTKTWPDLDADSAFAVQRMGAEAAVAEGDRVVGYKLGNIAKAMQDAFGLDQPDYGHLLASTFACEGTTIDRSRFIAPFVELEPAFVLKGHLRGPNATVAEVITAVDYVLPAIEIIDSRVENWAIDLPDTLADNGSTGAVVLGGTPRCLTDLTLRDTPGVLHFAGRPVMSGNTGNILGNPLAATAWLCNRLAAYDVAFAPGEVILPGSCLEAVPMREAGHWSGTFDGLGTVEFDVA
ncbi:MULTISPECIES: 2-keto-4-pentenoate hydratase [Amycolatopsis]|uniref:2-keto-4-pentenoate hydratase n=1 Tax=Amycolatopsis thermalba TaxID=944492 RepID=A0ABY4NYY1_9PSEU|nr:MULTISPECIES: 2-hydroxypenta-2,4-dienoate hydratase [Amycolatopsis]OXM75098.1 2-hydroxypenta-2,4-dienoate hydratase [Amycolatopsis sp. KNN50.9b]UQS25301.1 2-keto-4-pentenoate hydratase [Amycolatopsis thermalba]